MQRRRAQLEVDLLYICLPKADGATWALPLPCLEACVDALFAEMVEAARDGVRLEALLAGRALEHALIAPGHKSNRQNLCVA